VSILVNAREVPQPPTDVVARLRALSEDLKIGCFQMGRKPSGEPQYAWAVHHRWPLSDPRWARVQAQEIPEADAYDIICFPPLDCPVEEIVGYLERGLTAMHGSGNRSDHVTRLLNRVAAHNEARRQATWSDVEGKALELAQSVSNQANHAEGAVVWEGGTRINSAGIPGAPNGPAVKES
jgi:hypothetical protein